MLKFLEEKGYYILLIRISSTSLLFKAFLSMLLYLLIITFRHSALAVETLNLQCLVWLLSVT